MSNTVKVCRCLSKIFLNQSITVEEFFHWLSEVLFLTSVSILWRICFVLIICLENLFTYSLLTGLISLQFGPGCRVALLWPLLLG